MQSGKTRKMTLTDMPDDILTMIVSKVGSNSSQDYLNTILTTKSLHFSYKNFFVVKHMKLAHLVRKPHEAHKFEDVINSCLNANNKEAHYVKGMYEFFNTQNKHLGLHHLQMSANDGHDDGTYVYGVLLMAMGHINQGVRILNTMTEEKGLLTVEESMSNFQKSFECFTLIMEDCYVTSFINMPPPLHCHPPEINTFWSECFHSFLLNDFFEMVMGLN